MLLIPPIQLLMLLIRRARRSHRLPEPTSILPNCSLDAGFSCTEGTWKKPHVVSPSQIKRGQSMTTAAPREDEGELIYLPLLHIMSPRTLPNTHWLRCSTGSNIPARFRLPLLERRNSHKTFRLVTAETRMARGSDTGWNRALTHVEQQGSTVGCRRRHRFDDFKSTGSSTSIAWITC